jgi:hypothetical protein
MSVTTWIRRFFFPAPKQIWPPPTLCGDGTFSFEIVGESRHQDKIEEVNGGRSEDSAETEVVALLVPEPTNLYDANAVCVHLDGWPVGYLDRGTAEKYQGELETLRLRGQMLACTAMIKGGWDRGPDDRGHFGVFLDVVWPLQVDFPKA